MTKQILRVTALLMAAVCAPSLAQANDTVPTAAMVQDDLNTLNGLIDKLKSNPTDLSLSDQISKAQTKWQSDAAAYNKAAGEGAPVAPSDNQFGCWNPKAATAKAATTLKEPSPFFMISAVNFALSAA